MNWCSGPNVSKASAAVNSFIVDAGSRSPPAFTEYSVSPRVSDTIIAPQLPFRTRAFRKVPMSAARALAPNGAVWRSAGGGVRRTAVVRRAGVFFARAPALVAGRVFGFAEEPPLTPPAVLPPS